MVVPGLQALFGFQMMSIFNARFEMLSSRSQLLHLLALFLTTLSIGLIMTPAAYHRIVEPETGSEFFVRLTSTLIATAMVPLMISLTLDVYVVANLVAQRPITSAAMAILVFVTFGGLWFG